jgi:hypothetical protein
VMPKFTETQQQQEGQQQQAGYRSRGC